MVLETALPKTVQEQFEQAIRDVIAGVSQSTFEHTRELPPPRQDAFDLDLAPELDRILVRSFPAERLLGVDCTFGAKPDSPVAVVPENVDEPAYSFPARTVDRSPSTLAELRGGYAALSTALVETLATYCDAPDWAPERAFVGGEASLSCRSCYGELLTFSAVVRYPDYVEQIYAEGRGDIARRVGLPY